jgi:AraC family transcriptional regulator
MKVIVMVKATKSSEAGEMPSEQLLTEMGNYNEQLVKAGIMLSGEGLHPSSRGVRVRFSGKNRTVMDGPFAETNELVAGFWMWKVKSMEEAVEWVKKCPNPMLEDSEIEIRRVFEAADFGDALTPELREKEAILRATNLGLGPVRFEDGPAKLLAGINESYTMESRVNIPAQWGKFIPHLGNMPGQIGRISYGVSWNSKANCDFDYFVGVEVKEVSTLPEGFTTVSLTPQRYAVITHDKHVSAMPKTLEMIFQTWLPDSSLDATHAPCFETYSREFNGETGMGGMEIWIPVQAST